LGTLITLTPRIDPLIAGTTSNGVMFRVALC